MRVGVGVVVRVGVGVRRSVERLKTVTCAPPGTRVITSSTVSAKRGVSWIAGRSSSGSERKESGSAWLGLGAGEGYG